MCFTVFLSRLPLYYTLYIIVPTICVTGLVVFVFHERDVLYLKKYIPKIKVIPKLVSLSRWRKSHTVNLMLIDSNLLLGKIITFQHLSVLSTLL